MPEDGDWYARNMYIQGSEQYQHHLEHYGHPADTGFMEIDNLWKAENWRPEELIDLYAKAGARYFVSLANHHDNFDNYNSRFHAWNSTRVGPKRDIVGGWAKAARARGLKFGVSNHSAHAWHWFQGAYDYDPEGPRAGERYDGWKLSKYDGKGKWWEGLDPQELYCGAAMAMPDGIKTTQAALDYHATHDRVWDEDPPLNNPDFRAAMVPALQGPGRQLPSRPAVFRQYRPAAGPGGAGYRGALLQQHAWRGAAQLPVLNCKMLPEDLRAAVVEDVERGYRSEVVPHPWQTDTCIGDWHYNRERFLEQVLHAGQRGGAPAVRRGGQEWLPVAVGAGARRRHHR